MSSSRSSLCDCVTVQDLANRLRTEVNQLEFKLVVLKSRSLPQEQVANADAVLRQALFENKQLQLKIRIGQLKVAQMHSLLSRCMRNQQAYPIYSCIRLPRDRMARHKEMLALRERKLRAAREFVMTVVEPNKKKFSVQQFESADGDYCAVCFATEHFPGVKSLQQVFDAVMFYFTNNEICISERLGHITIRDEYESIGGKAHCSRLVSTNEEGATIESSTLVFPELSADGRSGAVVVDSVDYDELHPYNPSRHIRKDVSGAVCLTVNANDSTSERGLVVTMRRASFWRLHQPQFPLSEDAVGQLRNEIACWDEVMLKSVRSIVYGAH